jgi:hypothetical protein
MTPISYRMFMLFWETRRVIHSWAQLYYRAYILMQISRSFKFVISIQKAVPPSVWYFVAYQILIAELAGWFSKSCVHEASCKPGSYDLPVVATDREQNADIERHEVLLLRTLQGESWSCPCAWLIKHYAMMTCGVVHVYVHVFCKTTHKLTILLSWKVIATQTLIIYNIASTLQVLATAMLALLSMWNWSRQFWWLQWQDIDTKLHEDQSSVAYCAV